MKYIVAAAGLALLISGSAQAATGSTASTTGTANATVVAPLQIQHTSGAALNFGTFTAGLGGTVTVDSAGTGTAGSDVSFVNGNTNSADAFTVTGSGTRTFNITTSTGDTVSTGGPSPSTMAFTVSAPEDASLVSGSYTLNVGGELTVGSAQAAGSYTGSYTVTVTYQ